MILGSDLFLAEPLERGFSFEITGKLVFSAPDSISTDQAAIRALVRVATVTGRSVEGERDMAQVRWACASANRRAVGYQSALASLIVWQMAMDQDHTPDTSHVAVCLGGKRYGE